MTIGFPRSSISSVSGTAASIGASTWCGTALGADLEYEFLVRAEADPSRIQDPLHRREQCFG